MKKKQEFNKQDTDLGSDRYTTIIARGDNWFLARCMELGLIGQGRTESEAREDLRQAIRKYLAGPGEGGRPLPA